MSLSGQQRRILQEALIDAFPTKSSLEQMLSFELDKNLDAIAGEGSLQDIVFKLIQAANSQGWVEDLVRAARDSNQGNQLLKTTAQELFPNLLETNPVTPSKTSVQKVIQISQETDDLSHKYDVFISHASEDKDSFVRPLAKRLQAEHYKVWYDELSLTLGDSLSSSIDRGLAESRYGIVVLSHNSFKKRWPRRELEGLVAKEINGHKVILPIWHQVTYEDVVKFSPTLADKLAVNTSHGMDYVVNEIVKVLGKPSTSPATNEGSLNNDEKELRSGAVDYYTKLRDLLKAGQWQEANKETLAIMIKVAGREKEGWLDDESIKNFSCTDLHTIDQLWIEHSDGRFGFSVQKRIWESVGKDVDKFGDRVGWRKGRWMNKDWIRYPLDVTFDTTAKPGHLPVLWIPIRGIDGRVWVFINVWWSFGLFSRI